MTELNIASEIVLTARISLQEAIARINQPWSFEARAAEWTAEELSQRTGPTYSQP